MQHPPTLAGMLSEHEKGFPPMVSHNSVLVCIDLRSHSVDALGLEVDWGDTSVLEPDSDEHGNAIKQGGCILKKVEAHS